MFLIVGSTPDLAGGYKYGCRRCSQDEFECTQKFIVELKVRKKLVAGAVANTEGMNSHAAACIRWIRYDWHDSSSRTALRSTGDATVGPGRIVPQKDGADSYL